MGRLWARLMPRAHIFGLPLNPGPIFTIKEHVCNDIASSSIHLISSANFFLKVLVTIMAGVGSQSAYAVSYGHTRAQD